ncbi:MAG: 1-acyl-sn-glycerol-3-phosphate acyltransferase [Saprospiraceae bacterium]|nr:1-acyl-sn-glycerol-3-phosphate acyltransferase [Saprospiraceae bacterium]MDW8483067.1 lysophospholipid acyltransferase family protein [Saprospiraceae bacterium]
MSVLRAAFRLAYFLGFALAFIAWVRVRFWARGKDMRWALHFRQRWVHRYLLPPLGIHLRVEGKIPDEPCLFVGNHRSYIDPALVSTQVAGYPLAKAEIANWPLIGQGVRLTGVLLVRREDKSSRKDALAEIAAKICEGYSIILFPEGTTHADAQTREFRPGAFKVATELGLPIVPMAIDYHTSRAYWLNDDTFLAHFLRCFGEPVIRSALHFGPPIRTTRPQEAIAAARSWIDAQLHSIRQNFSQN